MFCRNQNLHISQTVTHNLKHLSCFVEIKIYISLKLFEPVLRYCQRFVEIKIYISLKQELEEKKYKVVL